MKKSEELKKKIIDLEKSIASPKHSDALKNKFKSALEKVKQDLAKEEKKEADEKKRRKALPPEVKKAVKNPDRFKKLIEELRKKPAYSFLKKMSLKSIKRDAQRTALPAGKRVSAEGNVYYESRRNRSDVSAKNKLAKGGDVDKTTMKYDLDKMVIAGIKHKKAPDFDYHTAKKEELSHPLGDVYLKGDKGYVQNGYDWYAFDIKHLPELKKARNTGKY